MVGWYSFVIGRVVAEGEEEEEEALVWAMVVEDLM